MQFDTNSSVLIRTVSCFLKLCVGLERERERKDQLSNEKVAGDLLMLNE